MYVVFYYFGYIVKHSLLFRNTVDQLSTMAIFLGGQSIHSLLFQPLYDGHLTTMVTFFRPQGGR